MYILKSNKYFLLQVEYMACRGPDGSLISADSAVELNEYSQERVPEDEVPFLPCGIHLVFSCGDVMNFLDYLLPPAALYVLISAFSSPSSSR